MNRFRGVLLFAFAILAMTGTSAFSSKAYAQARAKGEFKLSQAIHWGKAILPEGRYFYSVEAGSSPALVRVWQVGGSFTGVFVPKSPLRGNVGGETEIVLQQAGDGIYVSSFHVRELKAALDFSMPVKNADSGETDAGPAPETAAMDTGISALVKVVNPGRLSVSIAGAEKVYLNACQLIETEFSRATPVRPQVVLHLGAEENAVRYPNNEILLKRWDEFRFAQAVVEIALHELVSPEERLRLSDAAINQANATVSLCELKNCRN